MTLLKCLYTAWKTILPQLEATIELRREKKIIVEQAKRVKQCKDAQESRKKKLYDIVLSLMDSKEGNNYFISHEEFLKLPAAKKLLKPEGTNTNVSDADAQSIKEKVLEVGAVKKERYIQQWGRTMLSSLADSGYAEAIKDPSTEDCLKVLEHNYAFFLGSDWPSDLPYTFPDLLRLTGDSFRVIYWCENRTREDQQYKPCELAIKIGHALAKDLDIESLSMTELNLFQEVFICKRCEWTRERSRRFTWDGLVSQSALHNVAPVPF